MCTRSTSFAVYAAADRQFIDLPPDVEVPENTDLSNKAVHIILSQRMHSKVKEELVASLHAIAYTGFSYHLQDAGAPVRDVGKKYVLSGCTAYLLNCLP